MESKVNQAVKAFDKAATERNVEDLKIILHKDYRAMVNQFKGSPGTTIILREVYLTMMRDKKIGKTKYDAEFIQVSITDHTALAEVLLRSANSSDIHKYLFLVQNGNDEWKIISDLPVVID